LELALGFQAGWGLGDKLGVMFGLKQRYLQVDT
jgi:hypothetical protein